MDQTGFCRLRRAKARSPPQAITRPGTPAPAIGPGTLCTVAPTTPVLPPLMPVHPVPHPQKLPIAPIFIADSVSLAVSREKGREIAGRLRRLGQRERRSAGRLRASSRGVGGGSYPPHGKRWPPRKTRTPLLTPLVFHPLQVPLTCIEPCIFRPPVRPSVMRNGPPTVMRNGPAFAVEGGGPPRRPVQP